MKGEGVKITKTKAMTLSMPCQAGKHGFCTGKTIDGGGVHAQIVTCDCPCHTEKS
jgi:hypothetical protein